MQQHFDEGRDDIGGLVRIIGSRRALTPAQRQFNQLIERIGMQRRQLDEWRSFEVLHRQQVAERYTPAIARMRELQKRMALRIGEMIEGPGLSRAERAKGRAFLLELLGELLGNAADEELVRLHDAYAPSSFADLQRDRQDFLREKASVEFGIDLDRIPPQESPEELAQWLQDHLEAPPDPPRRKSRKKSARSIEREAARERGAADATRAVRELFRKLASELHPDRESDPAQRSRKTELMQRVNRAYKAGNLLELLELQLSIEQIDQADLATLAEERLHVYIEILKDQSQRLRAEIAQFTAPFEMHQMPNRPLSPGEVQRAMEQDIQEVDTVAARLGADLRRFADVQYFRRYLRDVTPDSLASEPAGRRSGPRRGRGGRRP